MKELLPIAFDFMMLKLKPAGKSLKADYDQAVEGEKTDLSLLSSEFEQVFSKVIRERMYLIKFMENRGGTLKIHSTISKKACGAMVTR